jgi:very-short-patch-repair endonuclease
MSKIPKELSEGEETFMLHCNSYHLKVEREFRFHDTRHWRFDFAIPEHKIGIEIEGGTSFGMSRHSRGEGFDRDAIKYNTAALLGWVVLRFSTGMVLRGEAIDTVRAALNRNQAP